MVYAFVTADGQQRHRRLYLHLQDAAYSAVVDLQEERAQPLMIRQGTRVLLDQAAIHQLWQACRQDLAADPWKVPTAVQALAQDGA